MPRPRAYANTCFISACAAVRALGLRDLGDAGPEDRVGEDLAADKAPDVVDVLGAPVAAGARGGQVADRLGLPVEAEREHRIVAVGVHHDGR